MPSLLGVKKSHKRKKAAIEAPEMKTHRFGYLIAKMTKTILRANKMT